MIATTAPSRPTGRRRMRRLMAVCATVIAAATTFAASPALADFGIQPGSFTAGVTDAAGNDDTQAGGHPFAATTSFTFNTRTEDGVEIPDEAVKDIVVNLPAGFVGDPQAVPQCSQSDLKGASLAGLCPADTQVGVTTLDVALGGYRYPGGITVPVYNMRPAPGVTADFAFVVLQNVVHVIADARTDGDYGLRTTVPKVSQALTLYGTELSFWGVPADPVHDPERGKSCFGIFCSGGGQSAGIEHKPFLTNPVDCTSGPLATTLSVDSWATPGVFKTYTAMSPEPTGCDKLSFHPTISVQVDSDRAAAPAGYTVDLRVPQQTNPDGLGTPELRRAVVTLPTGVTVSPSAAAGLAGCSDTQIAVGSNAEPTCPDASKIGTVSVTTPLLAEPMEGQIYLGTQTPSQLLRLFLVLRGPGLLIKLPGKVDPDPNTGQLTTTFDDNPQLPFSDFTLTFDGGPRAPLVNPAACGRKTMTAQLTSWAGSTVQTGSSFDVACRPGLGSFAPSFAAGTTNPVAGASSPFVMRFGRADGQQELGAINGSLPPGLLGVLKSVPLCSAAQGAAGTCGAASRVGKVQVAAGAGSSPLWLPAAGQAEDSVYLTEPYRKGDVAGMSIVVPAVAGPFDLGTVVTKVYLKLRPEDQGIDLQSDRLPRILRGIPLNIREVVVTIDRAGFMVNPTNCSVMATYANVFSQSWAKAPVSSRFQVGGCAALPLSPVIQVSGGGKGNTKRYTHPSLKVSIRQAATQAHLSKTNVVLPKALNVDLKAPALKASCPRDVYAKDECSPVATIGSVRAVTPLLREPLTGPAFLIQKKGQLPDIVMRLRNDRMSLDLIGVLDFLKDGRLITRVKGIPDAALSSFVLQIKGGKNGSLLNRSDLCARKRLTKATFKGQNGKLSRKSPVTRISGCASKASRSRAASRRAARESSARASAARGAHAARVSQRAAGGRS